VASKLQVGRYIVLIILVVGLVLAKIAYEASFESSNGPYDVVYGKMATQEEIIQRDKERRLAARQAAAERPPPPDPATIHGIERSAWRGQPSAWIAKQRGAALNTLSRTDVGLLVLPVQGDKNAFDPIERSLLARYVADRIETGTSLSIADPSAVFRFLGRHNSLFSREDVLKLVDVTRAERVLELHASHDRRGMWRLDATVWSVGSDDDGVAKAWESLHFGDASPPSVSIDQILDEVVEFATGETPVSNRKKYNFSPEEFQFPDTLGELIDRSHSSPLYAAAYLQMFGSLHPRGDFNQTRHELYERSLVLLRHVSPDSDYYAYFLARALAYLGRRPAAVKVLEAAINRDERALQAALDGNLPTLRKRVEGAGTSILDFMALRDLQVIEWRYDQRQDHRVEQTLLKLNSVWAAFIDRSLSDYAQWARYSLSGINASLDELIPDAGGKSGSAVAAQLASRGFIDELALTGHLWRRATHFLSIVSPQPGAVRTRFAASGSDVAELAMAIAVANHLREVDEDLRVRSLPEAALAELSRFEPIFSGHPEAELLKASALTEMIEEVPRTEVSKLEVAAADAKLNGLAWSGSLTEKGIEVIRNYEQILWSSSIKPTDRVSGTGFARYSRRYFEWPHNQNWFPQISALEVRDDGFSKCIEYTWTQFECVWWAIERSQRLPNMPPNARQVLLDSVAHRFTGHPRRKQFELWEARSSSSEDSEELLLRAAIDQGNKDWSMFYALGRIQFRRGDYNAAATTWRSFPDFSSSSEYRSLASSNRAIVAGSNLYWIGQHEEAIKLLQVAAAGGSGADAVMQARQRLALIAGDMRGAEHWAAERVRRYKNATAKRDLMQLQHIQGKSGLAWVAFDQQLAEDPGVNMWSGALVGHRVEGATMQDIFDWTASSPARQTGTADSFYGSVKIRVAPRYIVLTGLLDRRPEPDFAELVRNAYPRGTRARKRAVSANLQAYVDPAWLSEMRPDNQSQHDYPYERLAAAMAAFLRSDHEAALTLFNEVAYYNGIAEHLPYMAYSAAATGKAEHIRSALAKVESQLEVKRLAEGFTRSNRGYRFNEDLTYAVLASFENDHDSALEYLNAALNNRPYLDDRTIFPMYEIVDLADRLYERTGVDGYRDFALDVSRRHTVVLPMYAWAYFVVAKYSDSKTERVWATASGLHLDKLSERGKSLPKDLLEEANDFLESSGPPYLERPKRQLPRQELPPMNPKEGVVG